MHIIPRPKCPRCRVKRLNKPRSIWPTKEDAEAFCCALDDMLLIRAYGLALLSVAIALMTGLLLASRDFRGVEFRLFLFAIAITVWREGTAPGVFAVVLSSLAFNYFFTPPIYSL